MCDEKMPAGQKCTCHFKMLAGWPAVIEDLQPRTTTDKHSHHARGIACALLAPTFVGCFGAKVSGSPRRNFTPRCPTLLAAARLLRHGLHAAIFAAALCFALASGLGAKAYGGFALDEQQALRRTRIRRQARTSTTCIPTASTLIICRTKTQCARLRSTDSFLCLAPHTAV